MSIRDSFAGFPPVARWSVLGAAGVLIGLLVGTSGWLFLAHREEAAERAFAAASAAYRQAMVTGTEAPLRGAASGLRQFLKDYPRSTPAAQAWSLVGNVEYQLRDFDAARGAFEEAARRSSSGTVASLAQLGLGYAWEAKGDPQRALGAYQEGLKGREPKDFLYPELMLATARAQEQLKQPAAAIETYRRLLKDVPDLARADEVKSRLALLGAGA